MKYGQPKVKTGKQVLHERKKKMGREEIGQRTKMLFEGSETHTERQGQEV